MLPPAINAEPSRSGGGFSAQTMAELLRALRARAAEHPESPGLIASWPDVPASRMPAACSELQRQGHPVREIVIEEAKKLHRGWVLASADDSSSLPDAPAFLGRELTVLIRASPDPETVAVARRALTTVARREGATEMVCSAVALAVTEACTNVVVHAYGDSEVTGDLEVRASKVAGALVVEVADEGRGLRARLDRPGLGLGLLLMAQSADVLELRTDRRRRGVVAHMRFHLQGDAGQPAE